MDTTYRLLSRIVQPTDLSKLSVKELLELCKEVRAAILEKVSRSGGHLASNLGTVELTVAMYATYSIPPDKVIWDTGHQAYAHKMLTGRLQQFDSLRKLGGISGFLRRDEHPLDFFGAGHAGTAISAALGFASARDLKGTKEKVVAVTGDGAIVSGMSWEALNHAGELGTDFTVVLNDNRMSIAPNVGALTNYLSRLRSRPLVQGLARRAKRVVERMPDPVHRMASGIRHGITHYMAPEDTGTIFEQMGFEYIGPIDGHDLPTLLEIFRNVRDCNYPVFVHALTLKGKGYEVAEEDSRKWHGVTPFDVDSCQMNKVAGPITFTQAFGSTLVELAEDDPQIVAITAAMPDGTGLEPFAQAQPQRFFDTGIAEQHAVTFAAGLAASDLKPFCAIYSTFMQRGYDQILHDICIQKLPVRLCLDRAGFVGDDGATHHGVFDLSFLGSIPNMVVLAPKDTAEMTAMIRWMADYQAGPTAIRYPRGSVAPIPVVMESPIEHGKAEVLRSGTDITLCAIGSMVETAVGASHRLQELGISTEVINARFAKPIDFATILNSVEKTGRLITLEENVRQGGFGQSVCDLLQEKGVQCEARIVAIPDAFIEHGPVAVLRKMVGLDSDSVVAQAMDLIGCVQLIS